MLIKPPEETGLYLIEPEELEKQTKLLIILQKETNFLKKEPEVLEKLIKLAGEGGVADNFTEGDGGARETEETVVENAAVLEKLKKNGAFAISYEIFYLEADLVAREV